MRGIFSDELTYKYSGLFPYNYDSLWPDTADTRSLTNKVINQPFPHHTIATPLFIDYPGYLHIPKPANSRAIFILRDPRDILVSYYFSMLKSHRPIGRIPRLRQALGSLSQPEGLIYMLHYMHIYGTFEVQRSWVEDGGKDPNVLIVRFEDLVGVDGRLQWKQIMSHFDIQIPDDQLELLLEKYNFDKLSGGRKEGSENKDSHYRKGIHGDWINYFSEPLINQFVLLTGDLVDVLGYE